MNKTHVQTDMSNIPFRLCCGQQHLGPVCPDGKVMCCLCFKRVSIDELSDSSDGEKVNICKPCAELETQLSELCKTNN